MWNAQRSPAVTTSRATSLPQPWQRDSEALTVAVNQISPKKSSAPGPSGSRKQSSRRARFSQERKARPGSPSGAVCLRKRANLQRGPAVYASALAVPERSDASRRRRAPGGSGVKRRDRQCRSALALPSMRKAGAARWAQEASDHQASVLALAVDVRRGQQQGLPRPQPLQKPARALFGLPALDPGTLSPRPQRRTRRRRRRARRSVTRAPAPRLGSRASN